MEWNMATTLLHTSLTFCAVAVFPSLCWVEALTPVLIALYQHLSAEKISERTESVIKGGVLLAGIGIALIFIPTLQYFMVAVAITTFFKAEELSWLGERFVSMSASVAIWIFAYRYYEMTFVWFIGVSIFTFLSTAKTERNSSQLDSCPPVLPRDVSYQREETLEHPSVAGTRENITNTAPVSFVNPSEESGPLSDGVPIYFPGAGAEETTNNTSADVSHDTPGERNGTSDMLSDTISQASVQIKADSVTESNFAGIVHGGMGNITNTDSCISSVHDNICNSTTPESQDSMTTERVGDVERNVSNANVADTVVIEEGHGNNTGKSSTSMNFQNSKINSPILGGFEDASAERDINIDMKNVHIDGEHPRTTRPENAVQDDEDDAKTILKNVQETVTKINDKLDITKTQDTTPFVDNPSNHQFDAAQVQRDIEAKEKLAKSGRTPLMMAARAGDKTLFFELKDQTESYLTKQDKKSNNILHIACLGGNTDIVEYVLSQGLAIDSRGQYGRTPVMLAAQKGHRWVFKVLVDRGCQLVAEDADGNTVLHMACIGGNVEIVKYLIEHRTYRINTRGQYGRTPAMIAADKGHEEVFSYLLNNGCYLTLLDEDGGSCSFYARRGGNANIMGMVEKCLHGNKT